MENIIAELNGRIGYTAIKLTAKTIGGGKLTATRRNGEIIEIVVSGDIVTTTEGTFYITEQYGLSVILDVISAGMTDYKTLVGKEYSNKFGSIQKANDGTWCKYNAVAGIVTGYARNYPHAIEWLRLNAHAYKSGRSGLAGI